MCWPSSEKDGNVRIQERQFLTFVLSMTRRKPTASWYECLPNTESVNHFHDIGSLHRFYFNTLTVNYVITRSFRPRYPVRDKSGCFYLFWCNYVYIRRIKGIKIKNGLYEFIIKCNRNLNIEHFNNINIIINSK